MRNQNTIWKNQNTLIFDFNDYGFNVFSLWSSKWWAKKIRSWRRNWSKSITNSKLQKKVLVRLTHCTLLQWRHLKSNHSKSRLFEGRISNGPYVVVGFQKVPTIQNTGKMGDLVLIVLYENNFLFKLKMYRLMNFSKFGPFKNWTKIDHSKPGHVRLSDPHCKHISVGIWKFDMSGFSRFKIMAKGHYSRDQNSRNVKSFRYFRFSKTSTFQKMVTVHHLKTDLGLILPT